MQIQILILSIMTPLVNANEINLIRRSNKENITVKEISYRIVIDTMKSLALTVKEISYRILISTMENLALTVNGNFILDFDKQ